MYEIDPTALGSFEPVGMRLFHHMDISLRIAPFFGDLKVPAVYQGEKDERPRARAADDYEWWPFRSGKIEVDLTLMLN